MTEYEDAGGHLLIKAEEDWDTEDDNCECWTIVSLRTWRLWVDDDIVEIVFER